MARKYSGISVPAGQAAFAVLAHLHSDFIAAEFLLGEKLLDLKLGVRTLRDPIHKHNPIFWVGIRHS